MNNMTGKTMDKLIKAYGKNQRRLGGTLGFGAGVVMTAVPLIATWLVSRWIDNTVEEATTEEKTGE